MVFFNYSTMQMAAKVVYYGPGLCGKTTNLQWIFEHTSTESRGEMVSLATETDRTLFFDLLPIDVGSIAGFSTRIQLYTVPGQVFYNTTRKLVLKGVDGVVFVADSQRPMLQANVESFQNLEENLAEMGLALDNLPVVLQYNKRDLPAICSTEELNQALNRQGWPAVEASAINGQGVFETLKMISKATLLALKKRLTKSRPESAGAAAGGRRPSTPIARPPTMPRPAPVKKPAAPPPAAGAAAAAEEAAVSSPSTEAPPPDLEMDLEPPALEEAAAPADEAAEQPAEEAAAEEAAAEEAAAEEAAAEQPAEEAAAEEAAEPAAEKADAEEEAPPREAAAAGVAEAEAAETEEAAAEEAEIEEAAAREAEAAEAVPAAEAPAAPPAPKRRKPRRAAGFDALAELEKLRRQAIDPRVAAAENGKREISRDLRMTLKRADFSRVHRVSLILQAEDAEARAVDEAQHLHVDIDNASSLEEFLLRLNIALDGSA